MKPPMVAPAFEPRFSKICCQSVISVLVSPPLHPGCRHSSPVALPPPPPAPGPPQPPSAPNSSSWDPMGRPRVVLLKRLPYTMILGLSMAVPGVTVVVWSLRGHWGWLTRHGWLRCILPGRLCCVTVKVCFWGPSCFYRLWCGKGIHVLFQKIVVRQVHF